MRSVVEMKFSVFLILTIAPQRSSAQYLGLEPSFRYLGVNQGNHISEPDYADEDLDDYEEKEKPGKKRSLKTLWGDFSEMENLLKQVEKEESPQESQVKKTMDGDFVEMENLLEQLGEA